MSAFTKTLKVEILEGGKYFKLLEPVEYYRKDNASEIIKVPVGFVSDLATIPKIFWCLIPPQGGGTKKSNYAPSALLHDFLCTEFHNGKVTRKFADTVFLESMLEIGIKPLLAYTLWGFVRIFAKIKGYK